MNELWSKFKDFLSTVWIEICIFNISDLFSKPTEEIVPDPDADGRWRLMYGICNRSPLSVESISNYYPTEAEALTAYKNAMTYWTRNKKVIWVANLYDPNGKKIPLPKTGERPKVYF